MYLDSYPAIAVGREMCSYPKVAGTPKLYIDSDVLVGTLDYGSLRVAIATMGYKHHELDAAKAREGICRPAFMLKIMPDYMGKPRICELVRTQIADITIHGAWSGPARLQLFAHVMAPMADLPVLEVISASHILTDLSLAPATVVHDYLASNK
jgi:acetoacetate decarboxylase